MKLKKKICEQSLMRSKQVQDKYHIVIMTLLTLFGILVVGLVVFTRMQEKNVGDERMDYQRHYMFISQKGNSFISDRIYEEAKKYGMEKKIYVEQLGSFSDSDYQTIDYLKMAMAMKVDGIILEGSDDDEIRKTINQASDLEIPAVTILSDCAGSRRKSYIELGDYNLGSEYGQLVIQIAKNKTPKIVLLMDEDAKENESQIATGIRETMKKEGSHLQVQFRTERLETDADDTLWERIKEIMNNEEKRPDILICANEKDTETVYQYLVDYDLVGEVEMIGSGVSESLIEAVRDGGISALVDVDTKQIGKLCIDALNYYIENESVNEYIVVDNTVITSDNVERYMEDE